MDGNSKSNTEENFKIRVICPVCQKNNSLLVPKANILNSGKGLTTVFVHSNLVCEHSFQIFIDKNGKIRGHETPDFELKFIPTEEELPKPPEQEEVSFGIMLVIRAIFGEDTLLKCLRCALNKQDIICITESEIILKQFQPYFNKIFGMYTPKIEVVTLAEYNKNLRSQVFGSKKRNHFVFNTDLSVIIKHPFGKDKEVNFDLELSLLNLVNTKMQKDSEIITILQQQIEKIFETAHDIIDLVNHRKIKNRKELGKKIQKLIGKAIKCDVDAMDRILLYHFNYVPRFIDDRVIARSGFKY
jgi:hypothetical protein